MNRGMAFRDRFKTLAGRQFLGQRSLPTKSEATKDSDSFRTARYSLRVSADSFLTSGTTVVSPQGDKFLLVDNGSAGGFKSFRMMLLDRQFSWTRTTTAIDPVTKMAKENSKQPLGQFWGTLEPVQDDTDNLRIPKAVYRVITGTVLQEGDLLDDYLVVKRVETLLGVRVAEVS